MDVMIRDAETGELRREDVQDEPALRLLYTTTPGRWLTRHLLSRPWFSRVYSSFARSRFSRRSIEHFVRRFGIETGDFEDREQRTFNDFFIRRFKDGRRSFDRDPDRLPAIAEARYSGWSSTSDVPQITVKQTGYSVDTLLDASQWAPTFAGGPVLIARLAPQDYHGFHMMDDGEIVDRYDVEGRCHSVSPIATANWPGILSLNRRSVTVQSTTNFGLIAFVDVGAMTIGSIVSEVSPGDLVHRGDYRGYFQYGGSTIVILGEPGRWIPLLNILEGTREGIETFVRLGQPVGRRTSAQ